MKYYTPSNFLGSLYQFNNSAGDVVRAAGLTRPRFLDQLFVKSPGKIKKHQLVGGFKHFLFSIIYGMSSFPLTFIFFRGVGQPPTSFPLKEMEILYTQW
jgi:hypothetical protein